MNCLFSYITRANPLSFTFPVISAYLLKRIFLHGLIQNGDAFLHGMLKFFFVVVSEDDERILRTRTFEILRDLKIAACDVFIPVLQLPGVTIGVSFDHAFINDLRRGFHPDNDQSRILFS